MSDEFMSTESFASAVGVKPQTLRAALSRNGHYYGIRPVKMPNRLLRWPAKDVEKYLSGESQIVSHCEDEK